jgi:hypothetical protein
MRLAYSLVKGCWLLALFATLAFHLHAVFLTQADDSHIFFGWSLVLLTFPLGLVPMLTYGFLAQSTGGATNDIVLWLLMAAVGCFQWFWLIPRLVNWVKRRLFATR